MGFLDKVLGDLMHDSGGRNARRVLRRLGSRKILLAGGLAAADTLLNPKSGAPRGSGYSFTREARDRSATPPPAVPPAGLPPVPGVAVGTGLPRGTAQPRAGGGAESPTGPPPAVPPPPGTVPPPPGAGTPPAAAGGAARPAVPPPPDGAPARPEPPTAPGAESVPAAAPDAAGEPDAPLDPDAEADEELSLPPDLAFAAVRTMVAAALSDGHLGAAERSAVERRLGEAELSQAQVERIHKDLVLPASVLELAELATRPAERELLYQLAAAVVAADGQLLAPERDWLRGLAGAFGLEKEHARELEADVLAELGALEPGDRDDAGADP